MKTSLAMALELAPWVYARVDRIQPTWGITVQPVGPAHVVIGYPDDDGEPQLEVFTRATLIKRVDDWLLEADVDILDNLLEELRTAKCTQRTYRRIEIELERGVLRETK